MIWDAAKDAISDTGIRTQIGVVRSCSDRAIRFLLRVVLGRKLLKIVDNLLRSLQSRSISVCETQKLVSMTQVTPHAV